MIILATILAISYLCSKIIRHYNAIMTHYPEPEEMDYEPGNNKILKPKTQYAKQN
jgi:hypothetical protein